MRHQRSASLAISALVALAAGGCVSHGGKTQSSAGGDVVDEPATVVVDNRTFFDYSMYAERSGVRTRIGQVGANRSATLALPTSLVQPGTVIRIIGDPIGGGRPVAQQFTLSPGDQVPVVIPP